MRNARRRVLISYSFADREFAQGLASSINNLGGTAALSGHGAVGEADWLGGLRSKLAESDMVILVMPPPSARSANATFFEAGAARALGKEVVVVVPDIDSVDQSNILNYFACQISVQAVDARVEDRHRHIATGYGHRAVLLSKVLVWSNTLYAGGVEVRIGVERQRAITVERADSWQL